MRPVLRAAQLAVAVALLSSAPRLVEACSVCTAGRDEENQLAFLLTTIFMSILPLAMIGGLAFWFWRALKRHEAESGDDAVSGGSPSRVGASRDAGAVVPVAPSS